MARRTQKDGDRSRTGKVRLETRSAIKVDSRPTGKSYRTATVYEKPNGDLCVGEECFVVRIPKDNPGRIDLDFDQERCSPDQLQFLKKVQTRLVEGAAAVFNFQNTDKREET